MRNQIEKQDIRQHGLVYVKDLIRDYPALALVLQEVYLLGAEEALQLTEQWTDADRELMEFCWEK